MPQTKEVVFTMKKGVDVPDSFDGATIPILLPANNAEMLELAGENAYVIFNRARNLELQKDVKDQSNEDNETVETLRAFARKRSTEFGTPRVRGQGSPKAVRPAAVAAVLGDDFLSTLTPEQRAIYDRKMAEQTAKAAEASKKKAAEAPAAAKAAATPAKAPAKAAK